ncbi:MAG: ASCH domain-containing protein [Alphaproteobacteria bacterium]|nr:ASCH domain-containing protein [Alphaproteobacteria bacterium]
MEEAFWARLIRSANARGVSVNALVADIDRERIATPDAAPNLSSALRVWVLEQSAAGHEGHADWRTFERFSFGDGPALADELAELVLAGTKTATCWPVSEGPRTEVGKHMVVLDGRADPVAVIETVELTQRRFIEVGADFAHDEGEGDRSLVSWRVDHERYFTRNGGFSPDMRLYCERFRLVRRLVP